MAITKTIAWINVCAPVILMSAVLPGQLPAPPVTSALDVVTRDVVVADKDGTPVSGLRLSDFQVLEDGVPQTIVSFRSIVGGRPVSVPSSQAFATSGSLVLVVIEDTSFTALDTPRARDILRLVRNAFIGTGDLVGFISTGPSAITQNPTYDENYARFNAVIEATMGTAQGSVRGTAPSADVLRQATSQSVPAISAFLEQMAKVVDRRKTMVYVSGLPAGDMPASLVEAAARANVSIVPVDVHDTGTSVIAQGNSLKALAAATGGQVVVGPSGFLDGIRRVDDSRVVRYTIGYVSTNPDPLKIRRLVTITIPSRPDVTLDYIHDYTIPRPASPAPTIRP